MDDWIVEDGVELNALWRSDSVLAQADDELRDQFINFVHLLVAQHVQRVERVAPQLIEPFLGLFAMYSEAQEDPDAFLEVSYVCRNVFFFLKKKKKKNCVLY